MAQQIQDYLREKMPAWRLERPGVEEMTVAVMGCVVNGPGESKHASIGISLPGTFEEPKAPVFVDGRLVVTLKGDAIVPEFLEILESYVASRYATGPGREAALPASGPFRRAHRSSRPRRWRSSRACRRWKAVSMTQCSYSTTSFHRRRPPTSKRLSATSRRRPMSHLPSGLPSLCCSVQSPPPPSSSL